MSERLPARLRVLANELTLARERAGLTTRQVAARLGTSIATVNRTENAKRTASVAEVSAMLAIYGVIGADRKRIMGLIERLDAPHWLAIRSPHNRPTLRTFENDAISIVTFAPSVVPGLLQTRAYAQTAIGFGPYSAEDLRTRVEVRMARQAVLTKPGAPSCTAIVDEGVLRRPYCSSERMAEQIRWMMSMAKLPNVSIRVIPFRHGEYHNPGHFSKLDFRSDPPIIYVEHKGASGFLDKPEDAIMFQQLTESLSKAALSSADSVNFMAWMAADHERA